MARTALVTGASRGIGAAIADRLRADGYDVVAPPRASLDLSSAEHVQSWLASAAAPEAVDVVVNNAGINPISRIAELGVADWEAALLVNLTAPMLISRHYAERMARRGGGRLLNVTSCYSIVSRPSRGAYGAAKAGLNSLTRTLALEYAADSVLVNAVAPGFVETELTRRNNTPADVERLRAQIPLARLAAPEEIAELAAFLVSLRNSYVTGQVIVADGGFLCQ